MNRHFQPLLDLELPAPPPAAVPVRVRALATPIETLEPAVPGAAPAARELWAAVQLGAEHGALADAHPEALPAALAVLVRRAHGFTPRVALESPDAVLLELAGSQRLFGGLPALLAALRAAFPRPLQLALAPTPLAAVLLARAGRNCCITSPARLAGRLAPLALRHLQWPEEELARLTSMGVHTLGELLRLPRAGLARRIGPERLWQLDRLAGTRADPRAALEPEPRFRERVDPDFETLDRERLLGALQPVLARLEEFLRERQRGVMALQVVLHHRRGAPVPCLLRTVVPEYRAARFTALLAARLEALVLGEPVRRLELVAGRLRRFAAASGNLWAPGEQGGDAGATAAPEFLQTLLARLGERAVYGIEPVDEHRPERQGRGVAPMVPGEAAGRARGSAVPGAGAQAMREGDAGFAAAWPLGLIPEPQLLQTLCDAAGRVQRLLLAGQDLTLVSGPERIESGWWDGHAVARDYYIARADDGAQWWIYRECGAPRRWFVHGCYA